MSCGGSVTVALYPMKAKVVKEYGIKNIVTKSQELGKSIRTLAKAEASPEAQFVKDTKKLRPGKYHRQGRL